MIDHIKIDLAQRKRTELLKMFGLDYTQPYKTDTHELVDKYIGTWRGYKITLNAIKCTLEGSITKAINESKGKGPQNYDDVTYDEIVKEIETICEAFRLDPAKATIQNIEYSVNLILNQFPMKLMINQVIAWDSRPVNKNLTYDNTGKLYEWQLSKYSIKLYDKSAKERLPYHLLRFEKRVGSSCYISKHFNITTLKGLKEKDILKAMQNDLVHEWDKLLMIETTNPEALAKSERVAYNEETNPKRLEQYQEGKNTAKDRKRHSRNKNTLWNIIERLQLDTIKQKLKRDMLDQFSNF